MRRKLAVILDPAEYARLIEQPEWDEQISVCGTETVKGLGSMPSWWSRPVSIEDDRAAWSPPRDLYVAMTRPTKNWL